MKTIHLTVEDHIHKKFIQFKEKNNCLNHADAFSKMVDDAYIPIEEYEGREIE